MLLLLYQRSKQNILLAGRTGVGKTQMLESLLRILPSKAHCSAILSAVFGEQCKSDSKSLYYPSVLYQISSQSKVTTFKKSIKDLNQMMKNVLNNPSGKNVQISPNCAMCG